MEFERASGILLHPTSFPGPYGIGDLGNAAYEWIDFLAQTGQKLWQVLPLTPTGYGDSPYASFSAFAGNTLLISPDILVGQGLLSVADVQDLPEFSQDSVEFGPVIEWKTALLRQSYELYKERADEEITTVVSRFEQENASWLEDFALFMACKNANNGAIWSSWESELARHQPEAIAEWSAKLADEVRFQKYLQFLFFQQWNSLKQYANSKGIKIIGDVPIFVAYDSADVWANPQLFHLDENGKSTVVAGVPPDYFSATGQRWGNPLYRWDVMEQTGYAWWVERFRTAFQVCDIVRIDHFRGFEAYWEVPAYEETAINGRWVAGPGDGLFRAVFAALGEQPIIAEDLGLITPEVKALRVGLGLPGMRVLQFAFGGDARELYLPHNYEANTVVYTGTHDNDTTVGWLATAQPKELDYLMRYLGEDKPDTRELVCWKLVRLAWQSVANTALTTLQDLLLLDSTARMNAPGRAHGNWGWRYREGALSEELAVRLADITLAYGRYVPQNL